LFSLLMQAAGRAGRDVDISAASEMWLQTFHPQHPLFESLKRHDYPTFAAQQLKEREQAGMPPFSFQALVRAEARTQEVAQGFLSAASAAAAGMALPGGAHEHPARGQCGAGANADREPIARGAATLFDGLAGGAARDPKTARGTRLAALGD
jgi:hypothetical protein